MNQPWIYMYSPSQSPLPPPSPPDPSGSSQCTRSEHLSHASSLGWWSGKPDSCLQSIAMPPLKRKWECVSSPLCLMTTVWYPFPAGHMLWLPLGNSSAPCCLVQAKTVEAIGLKRELRGACILMTYIDRITGGSLGSARIKVTFLLPFISSGTGS